MDAPPDFDPFAPEVTQITEKQQHIVDYLIKQFELLSAFDIAKTKAGWKNTINRTKSVEKKNYLQMCLELAPLAEGQLIDIRNSKQAKDRKKQAKDDKFDELQSDSKKFINKRAEEIFQVGLQNLPVKLLANANSEMRIEMSHRCTLRRGKQKKYVGMRESIRMPPPHILDAVERIYKGAQNLIEDKVATLNFLLSEIKQLAFIFHAHEFTYLREGQADSASTANNSGDNAAAEDVTDETMDDTVDTPLKTYIYALTGTGDTRKFGIDFSVDFPDFCNEIIVKFAKELEEIRHFIAWLIAPIHTTDPANSDKKPWYSHPILSVDQTAKRVQKPFNNKEPQQYAIFLDTEIAEKLQAALEKQMQFPTTPAYMPQALVKDGFKKQAQPAMFKQAQAMLKAHGAEPWSQEQAQKAYAEYLKIHSPAMQSAAALDTIAKQNKGKGPHSNSNGQASSSRDRRRGRSSSRKDRDRSKNRERSGNRRSQRDYHQSYSDEDDHASYSRHQNNQRSSSRGANNHQPSSQSNKTEGGRRL